MIYIIGQLFNTEVHLKVKETESIIYESVTK